MRNQRDRRARTRLGRREFLKATAIVPSVAALGSAADERTARHEGQAAERQNAIYLTDMDRCQPQSALSRKPRRNHWRLLEYKTERAQGVMIVAGQNTEAPQIIYPVARKGWHAIYIGLHSSGACQIFQNVNCQPEDETRVEVRLTSDSTFSLLTQKQDTRTGNDIDDFFWKCADLTGEDIALRQFCRQVFPPSSSSSGKRCDGAWIAYIKLVPLTDEEVQNLAKDRKQKSSRRLFAHNDAFDYLYYLGAESEAEIRREIEHYRDTDFSRIIWEGGGGDRCNYFTKIGLPASVEWIEDNYMLGERYAAENWAVLRKKGIDPFRVALEYAHQIGLEFHAGYRTAGFHFPVPEDEWNAGGLYDKHPEWRGMDRRGRATPRLSYAYAEVQEFAVSLLKEMAGYPIDGVCLLYNRRPPLVEYEPPLVEGFQAKYGKDPRTLDEMDPSWLTYRAAVLTQFMRAVRKGMNEVASEQNRTVRLEVSAVVMGNQKQNLYYGMDLETWIKEGLVDTIIPYSSEGRGSSMIDSFVEPKDTEYFVRITRNTNCKLVIDLLPRQLSPEEYRRRAHVLYQAGVENLFFWDTNQRTSLGASWTALRRLGHREEIAAWARSGSPKIERPGSKLLKLGDWDLGYDSPG